MLHAFIISPVQRSWCNDFVMGWNMGNFVAFYGTAKGIFPYRVVNGSEANPTSYPTKTGGPLCWGTAAVS
jgi:hypothetical protein